MAKVERVREVLSEPLSPEYLQKKAEEGWKPVAVEWQRELAPGEEPAGTLVEDVPYGLRIAPDGRRLEENPAEKQALLVMMEQIVLDNPLAIIADELNRRGFRTRRGTDWSAVAVFNMLPRLIDAGPQLLSGEEWVQRRRQLVLAQAAAGERGFAAQDRPRH